jgi:protein SCO1
MFRASLVLKRCVRIATSSSRQFSSGGGFNARGPITFFGLGIAIITGGVIMGYYTVEKDNKKKAALQTVNHVGKPDLGGPWVLVDQDGIPRTDASYRGRFTLLYFGFTHCPDICPSELVKVGDILNMLGMVENSCLVSQHTL